MRQPNTLIAAILLLSGTAARIPGPLPAAELYVARQGNDSNPGTEDSPFATVAKAQRAVRTLIGEGLSRDVTVWIREGTYRLTNPLIFGPEDSGTERYAVTYRACPGHRATLSGGRPIGGWKQAGENLWVAIVPGVREGWTFRNLFVADRRATRARTPNLSAEPNCRRLAAVEPVNERQRFLLTVEPGILGNWQNVSDIELMIAGNWAINRIQVERLDAAANQIVPAAPYREGPGYIVPSKGRWYHIENARELLDQPGEWYLNRTTGQLTYWPREGEDMRQVEVVAPSLEQLVVVAGAPDTPVRNLHFRDIRFEHTNWALPEGGYMGIQASHYGRHPQAGRRWLHVPAAICFTDAHGCSVENAALARLGGSGLELADRCIDNVIRGNHISDVSANGVMVGGPNSENEVPKRNEVSNSRICACGVEFYGAIGIWVGFAQETTVSHNLVHDLPYTGVSVGWQWAPNPTSCRDNLIAFNHVHDVMKRLCDGGCIYTLGLQPDTVIRGNHLHDVHRSPMAQGAPNNGMFIDQGSKGYLFEENVIYQTAEAFVRFNQCERDWHTWRNNHFGDAAEVRRSAAEIIAQAGPEPAFAGRWTTECSEK